MADRKTASATIRPADGEYRVGSSSSGANVPQQGVLYIQSTGKASLGSVLALDAVSSAGAVTTVYIWANTDGSICTGTTFPTDTEAGSYVGDQAAS